MPEQLSKDDIENIYKSYYAVIYEMCINIRTLSYGISIERYLQQLVFSMFLTPIFLKNGLILDSSNKKISVEKFLELLKGSRDIRRDFFKLFNTFRRVYKRKKFTVNNQTLYFTIPFKFEFLDSEIDYRYVTNLLGADWNALLEFVICVLEKHGETTIEAFSTIYERSLNRLVNLTDEDNITKSKIDNILTERRKKGVYYTPPEITSFMNKISIFSFLANLSKNDIKTINDLIEIKNIETLVNIQEKLSEITILDLACGSGDFLISAAQQLYEISLILNEKLKLNKEKHEIKKWIIENNLFGVDLLKEAIAFAKVRLFIWSIKDVMNVTTISSLSTDLSYNLDSGNSLIGLAKNEIIWKNNLEKVDPDYLSFINNHFKNNRITMEEYQSFQPFHWNLKFRHVIKQGGFDIIISNPPYIEIKKFRNEREKKVLSKLYLSAYKLYDISILFIERGLQLLKEDGFLSFIITNKFISTDFGRRIRNMILSKTKIHSIIDVSYLPIFQSTATYPIIFSIQKPEQDSEVSSISYNKIKIVPRVYELDNLHEKYNDYLTIKQSDFSQFPNEIFVLTENYDFISNIENNPEIVRLNDLGKFNYRILGFTNWIKFLENISTTTQNDNDLPFIGTTNIDSYFVNTSKEIKLAKKRIKSSYLQYHDSYQKQWSVFKKPKLLIKEIAIALTVAFDPGTFANVTGIYMFIPDNHEILKTLLVILNSRLIQNYFKILYGSTHMAGGYLRFNGSYLKQMPIILPDDRKPFNIIADYLIILKKFILENASEEITKYYDFFSKIADILVISLYFPTEISIKLLQSVISSIEPIKVDTDIYSSEILNESSILKTIKTSFDKISNTNIMTDIENAIQLISN
ncbi:MAG: N-6 DNA methylase [Candidatus Heimdallarchaeota archaeon]